MSIGLGFHAVPAAAFFCARGRLACVAYDSVGNRQAVGCGPGVTQRQYWR